jgi:hypothetical protein
MTASASALLSSSVRTGFISRGSLPNSPGNPAIRVPSGCGLELGTIALPAEATMRLRPPRRWRSERFRLPGRSRSNILSLIAR